MGFDRSVGVCQLKKRKDALDGRKKMTMSSTGNNAGDEPLPNMLEALDSVPSPAKLINWLIKKFRQYE